MEGDTRSRAVGRWREILPALGINPLFLNGKHQACPMCGGKDRARFHDRTSEGNYICGQCGAGDGFTLLQKFHSWSFAQTANEVDKVLGRLPNRKPPKPYNRALMTDEEVERLWKGAQLIRDNDPVANYLRSRGITDLGYWPVALRFMDRWKHRPSEKFLPCMFALLQAPDGSVGTIHRTYLADVEPNRMFLPRRIPIGGAIRLAEVYSATLGVAEGIETALSASLLFRMPVWATTSERLLRDWQPPEGARRITVFADNDENFVGQASAYHLAHRLTLRHGYRVEVKIPDVQGWDWNDVLKNEIATERHVPAADMPELRMQHHDIRSSRESVSDS